MLDRIIAQNGLALTEYEEKIPASSNKFLERNRIVAGLGKGLLVVEALFRSGTSVTAKIAIETKKQVFSMPRKYWKYLFCWN